MSILWCSVILSTSAIPFRLCNCNDNSPRLKLTFDGVQQMFSKPTVTCTGKVCFVKFEGRDMKLTGKIADHNVTLKARDEPIGSTIEYSFPLKTFSFNVKTVNYNREGTTFYTVEEDVAETLMQTIFEGDPPLIFKFLGEAITSQLTNKYPVCYSLALHRPALGFKDVLDWPKFGKK